MMLGIKVDECYSRKFCNSRKSLYEFRYNWVFLRATNFQVSINWWSSSDFSSSFEARLLKVGFMHAAASRMSSDIERWLVNAWGSKKNIFWPENVFSMVFMVNLTGASASCFHWQIRLNVRSRSAMNSHSIELVAIIPIKSLTENECTVFYDSNSSLCQQLTMHGVLQYLISEECYSINLNQKQSTQFDDQRLVKNK